MMHKLFVYGTLKEHDVQRNVFGRVASSVPDSLEGFRMSLIAQGGATYPIILPEADGVIDGLVLEVTTEELALIDRYETEDYKRVRVTLVSGTEAWVYRG